MYSGIYLYILRDLVIPTGSGCLSFLAVFLLLLCLQLLCSLNKPTQLVLLCQDLEKVKYEGNIVGFAPYVLSAPPLELCSLLMQGLLYPAKSGVSALQIATDVASFLVRDMQAEVLLQTQSLHEERQELLQHEPSNRTCALLFIRGRQSFFPMVNLKRLLHPMKRLAHCAQGRDIISPQNVALYAAAMLSFGAFRVYHHVGLACIASHIKDSAGYKTC